MTRTIAGEGGTLDGLKTLVHKRAENLERD